MPTTDTTESGLESLIVKSLITENDYEEGTNVDYNKKFALNETRLWRFLRATQPKKLERMNLSGANGAPINEGFRAHFSCFPHAEKLKRVLTS